MKLRCWWLGLLFLSRVGAQDLAPDSVANTVVEVAATGGALSPNTTYVLTSAGISCNIRADGGPVVPDVPYAWTKTGSDTGTLEFISGATRRAVAITFTSRLAGRYRDTAGDRTIRFTPFTPAFAPPLRNLSQRTVLSGSQITTIGFVVSGATPRQVLVRAIGPSLGQFGVGQPATSPVLAVYSGSTVLVENSAWGGTSALTDAFAAVGAFALPATSKDCAALLTLSPGGYTAQVRATGGGEVLVEVYFVN